MPYIRTAAEAELNAAQQMQARGYPDAVATPVGPDSGIDVVSSQAVAQVKWRGAQVSRPEVQNLSGARGIDHHKEMWFFAASGYTKSAIEYANQVFMLLFTYDPSGEIEPINDIARQKLMNVTVVNTAYVARVPSDLWTSITTGAKADSAIGKVQTFWKQYSTYPQTRNANRDPKPTTTARHLTSKVSTARWFSLLIAALSWLMAALFGLGVVISLVQGMSSDQKVVIPFIAVLAAGFLAGGFYFFRKAHRLKEAD